MNDTTRWEDEFVEKFGYLEQKGEIVTGLVIVKIRSILASQKQAVVQMIEELREDWRIGAPWTQDGQVGLKRLEDILNELKNI